MFLKDKNVLVVGLATSGVETVNTLLKLGAKVTINDKKSESELVETIKLLDREAVHMLLGKHPDDLESFDLIILSPGVPTDLPFITRARQLNKMIMGELELAYQLCPATFIGITGTNGKTTTTALTGEIFKNAQKETYVVGNIGIAAISKALDAHKDAVMVTETSSFQLESTINFKPSIGAILNITPDHLNRHKTMENYIQAKANIFKNQDQNDFLVLNADSEEAFALKDLTKSTVIPFSRTKELEFGVYVKDHNIVLKDDDSAYKIVCDIDDIKIPGNHNVENILAAVAIAHWGGVSDEIIRDTIKRFMGVEHRIEFVAEIEGVRFVNDSKGTNPDASIRALEAMKTPVVLIAGGMDKGSDFTEFIGAFDRKVKHMVLLGETAQKIKETAQENGFNEISIVGDMEEAVEKAFGKSEYNDTVLLSPACASWDMYPSFEVRGKHFKGCVEKLRR